MGLAQAQLNHLSLALRAPVTRLKVSVITTFAATDLAVTTAG
jgi:hypothetical protein